MSTWSYYSAVARLAPGGLAGVPVRRLQGLARQALYRRRVPVGPAALLEALGLPEGGPPRGPGLAERVLDTRCSRLWCDVDRRTSVLQALESVPGARARALARAEAVVERRFELFGTPLHVPAGAPVPWSLDPVSGHAWPDLPVEQLRVSVPGADVKYPWVLGRLDWAVALAQGAWAARGAAERRRVLSELVVLVQDFLRSNPVGRGVHWTCSMEVALRAANLAVALTMLADQPEVREPGFLAEVLSALVEHCAFVEAHLEDGGAVPNNHLVSDLVGLLVVGALLPALPGAWRWRALGAEGLSREVLAQVHPDGLSFEGSVPYHRLALELFTLAWLAAEGTGLSLGPAYEARLRGMYAAAAALASERGVAAQVGDNDSGRAWPLEDRASLDFSYVAPLGAALFGDAWLKAPGAAFPAEAAWLTGAEGLLHFEALPAGATARSVAFPQGGLYVLRGADAFVAVSAGAQGQHGVGGHSHNDKLSFELHLGGVPVVVDAGTGTYTRDPVLRNRLRGTAAHNAPQVDGEEMAPLAPGRLFALPDATRARVEVFQTGEALDRLVARHDGYRRLAEPVSVVRTLLLDKRERALSVADGLEGRGLHTVGVRIHFPDANARLRAPREQELARALRVPGAPRAFTAQVVELGEAHAPRAVVLLDAGLTPALEPAVYSPGYGQVFEALQAAWHLTVRAPAVVRWVVLFL